MFSEIRDLTCAGAKRRVQNPRSRREAGKGDLFPIATGVDGGRVRRPVAGRDTLGTPAEERILTL